MTPTINQLMRAEHKLIQADRDFAAKLLRRFPPSTLVTVLLRYGQKNPTLAIVTGICGRGIVVVKLLTTDRRGNPNYKRIHWSRVAYR